MANALRQISGVTGRRLYPRYGASIRERASFLPQIYAERDRQALEESKLDLAQKTFQEGKSQAEVANKLAVAGLGIQGAMLVPQWRAIGGLTEGTTQAKGAPTEETGSWYGPAVNALREHWFGTLAGGGAGGIAGAMAGKELGGKKDEWWKVAGGALGGGAGAYGATGDPYAAAAGALLGGVVGGIF